MEGEQGAGAEKTTGPRREGGSLARAAGRRGDEANGYGPGGGIMPPAIGPPGSIGGPLRQLFGTAHCIVGLTNTGANWMRWQPPQGPQPPPPQPALIW